MFEILICLLTKRWHKVGLPGVKWMSFKLDQILSLVMLIFVPVRIQALSFQVHASNATPLRESRNICIVLTGIIQSAKCSCNITDLEYKNMHHCRVCDSDQHPMLHCAKWLNGDILFQLTNLLSKSHND